ncbi:hypothetical protein Hanom_Chr04g00314361 [Helianthus anomalus]
MFIYLTKQTKSLVCFRLFNKRTNTNKLLAKQFKNCSPNIWFVCSPNSEFYKNDHFGPG